MKNKPYPYYELPQINDLRHMLIMKKEQTPDRIAFTFMKDRKDIVSKSYGDFWEDVNRLGTWIYSKGYKGRHIAIIGDNSYEWLVVFFAVVNGGCVAVPIDKELPAEEIDDLLCRADISVVFCSKTIEKRFAEIKKKAAYISYLTDDLDIYIKEGQGLEESGRSDYMECIINPEKMCCIMFTSGTSGVSKGVMLSQKNIAQNINSSCKLFELSGSTIAFLPFHHAFGLVVGTMMAFNYGFPIHINKSLKTVKQAMLDVKPQTLFLVPLFVETFHKQIWENAAKSGKEKLLKNMMRVSNFLMTVGIDLRRRLFAEVRNAFGGELEYIISGGAAINVDLIKEFRSFGIEILNGYGTTECSPGTANHRNYYHKDGTVGMPVADTEIRIADDGEVMVRGPHVMLGYYKDEISTNEVLKDGWYATGDLGFLDKDGFLTLTGRKKNLIILSNGENISPEELETDFLKNDAVKEVIVYEKAGMIVAEIFPDADFLEKSEVRDVEDYFDKIMLKINKNRPQYKQVARVIIREEEFPKNTSKKIIRF